MAITEFHSKMLKAQRTELTEAMVYYRVAEFEENEKNRMILLQIAQNEEKQADIYIWKVPFYKKIVLWIESK